MDGCAGYFLTACFIWWTAPAGLGISAESIGAQSAGGLARVRNVWPDARRYDTAFVSSGKMGAFIVYATLCLISLLFLTNFRLGEWIRNFMQREPAAAANPKSTDEVCPGAARA